MGSSGAHTLPPDSVATSQRQPNQPCLSPGTVLAGRYEIIRSIGKGGMGEVYLARHKTIERLLAVKLLSPSSAIHPRMARRFLQEAKATSSVRHQNIVEVTDFGEFEGLAFFVMEYIEGEDLHQRLQQEGRLPWQQAKSFALQLLDGLRAVHDAGIIHRDVKPHNCVLAPGPSGEESVKLIDFGIAKLQDPDSPKLTDAGTVMGSTDYMSPEQGHGNELDPRSDLYAVGVLLYRCLTGVLPFKASHPTATLYLQTHVPPTPPSEACPKARLSTRVDAIVLKALSANPDDRYADAEEFIAALHAVDRVGEQTWPASRISTALGLASVAVAALYLLLVPPSQGSSRLRVSSVVATAHASAPERPALSDKLARADATRSRRLPRPHTSKKLGLPTAETPHRRPRDTVRQTLRQLRGKVNACRKKAGLFPGENVELAVSIGTDGKVQRVDIRGSHTVAGERCIASAMKRADFGPAQQLQHAKHRFEIR